LATNWRQKALKPVEVARPFRPIAGAERVVAIIVAMTLAHCFRMRLLPLGCAFVRQKRALARFIKSWFQLS
jgi:hypothetical protein